MRLWESLGESRLLRCLCHCMWLFLVFGILDGTWGFYYAVCKKKPFDNGKLETLPYLLSYNIDSCILFAKTSNTRSCACKRTVTWLWLVARMEESIEKRDCYFLCLALPIWRCIFISYYTERESTYILPTYEYTLVYVALLSLLLLFVLSYLLDDNNLILYYFICHGRVLLFALVLRLDPCMRDQFRSAFFFLQQPLPQPMTEDLETLEPVQVGQTQVVLKLQTHR